MSAAATALIMLAIFSCSKKTNVRPLGPDDISTATNTFAPLTSTQTPTRTSAPTPVPTNTIIIASVTTTRTVTASSTITLTTTGTMPMATGTQTMTFTITLTPTATTVGAGPAIYNGDTIGSRLQDGNPVNAAPGSVTEVTGGDPGNMMKLTFASVTGWWQQQEWDRTAAVNIGADTYLVFNVKQDASSPGTVNQLKVRINWTTGTDVFVANYLVEGGVIDTTWKTAKIPLAGMLGTGQTQVTFLTFINNWSADYTVDIDNVSLQGSVPSATPTITNTVNPLWTATSTPTITPTSIFVHPGAWSSAAELAFVKSKIASNSQPWLQQYNNLIGQTGSASSGVVYNGTIDDVCPGGEGNVQTDSALVYANALAWYLTGTTSYYTKAMTILANYATMQGFSSSGCGYSQQDVLDAGWFGVLFANACELLRMSPNWTPANTTAYVTMFKTAFYPLLNTMCPDNGNIDLTQIDAMFSMAVFCDDQAEWNMAVTRYQNRMPGYFYDSTWPTVNNPTNPDTGLSQPYSIPGSQNQQNSCSTVFPMNFWNCPLIWTAGLEQETCRDNGHHVQFALDAAVECAEIDYHQGSPANLYTTYQTSLVPALELLAQQFVTNTPCGTCSGSWNPQSQVLDTFEIGFNHYANRKGMSSAAPGDPLYYTNQWITSLRANSGTTWLQFNIAFETLTHAGVN